MEQMSELQWLEHIAPIKQKIREYQLAMDHKWINNRMEDSGISRCLAMIQREAKLEKEFQEKTDHAAIVNERTAREVALAQEIAELRRKEICELQRRHQVRQNDPELRNLIRSLEEGYTCRDQKQQILYNEYKKQQEKAQEHKAQEIMVKSLMNDQEQMEYEDRIKIEKSSKYRKDIQEQIINRVQQEQCQYEDTLIEKKMLDEIMKTIYDEDMREINQKKFLQARTREEMEKTAAARKAWKEKQKQMLLLEEKKIERQAQEKLAREQSVSDEKERRMKEREEMNHRMAMKTLAAEKERQARLDFITELQMQEYLEKNLQDDINELENEERNKKQTRATLSGQVEMRASLAREAAKRDLQIRIQAAEDLRLSEEKELAKERAKREKGRLYSQELMKQIEENKRRKEVEKRGEEARDQMVKDYLKECDAKIATERKKIVEEHVPPVLGYFRAGVITSQDIPAIKAGVSRCPIPGMENIDIDKLETTKVVTKHPKCNRQCTILRDY